MNMIKSRTLITCTAAVVLLTLPTACSNTTDTATPTASTSSASTAPTATDATTANATVSETPYTAPACESTDLVATLTDGDGGAAGSTYPYLVLTNNGTTECTMEGFPGVSLIDEEGNQIGAAAERDESVTPTVITLEPGDSAHSELQITNAEMFDAEDCQPVAATSMRVYPPDQTDAITVDATGYTGCAAEETSIITVRALEAGRE